MATAQRQTVPALIDRLLAAQQGNDDLFQLVRLLERLARAEGEERRRGSVGSDCPPADEPVRFHAVHHLGFPGREVDRVWQEAGDAERGRVFHVAVSSIGLTGPTGTLPRHYTSLVQARLKQRDRALADFLDLFHHRLVALLYRAWAKYRLTVQHEAYGDSELQPPIGRALQALVGEHGQRGLPLRLYYGGHFARQVRSATGLERMLADFLGHCVRVEPFVGRWLPIREADRAILGSGARGHNNRLGDGVLLGRRVWDVQSKYRIVIGPISPAEHARLLPDRPRFAELTRLIREYSPVHLDVELNFLIQSPARERTATARSHSGGRPSAPMRLGWNAWLQGRGDSGLRIATVQLRG